MSKKETDTFHFIDDNDDVAYVSVKLDNEDNNKSSPDIREQENEEENNNVPICPPTPKFKEPPISSIDVENCKQIDEQEQETEEDEDKGIIDTILQNHPKFRYPTLPLTREEFFEQVCDVIKYYPQINVITPFSERFSTQIQFLRLLYRYIYHTPFYLIKHKVSIVISVSNNCVRLLKEITAVLEQHNSYLTLEQQEEAEFVRTLLLDVWHKYNTRMHRIGHGML